jgi:phage terminase large subunit GpA-like protein
MKCPVFGGIHDGAVPKFQGTVIEWLQDNVRLPHSARSTYFDSSLAPWLNDIIKAVQNDDIQQIVICAPTGGAKTTLLELVIPYIIAQQPGPALLVSQNDDESKDWADSRLMPILENCEPVAKLFPSDRHLKRKTSIIFPHMPVFISGANISSLQSKSMRYCIGDETWQWKNGMIGEMKKRHHDRWNRKTILVTQGWDEGHDMDREFASGLLHEWGYECEKCNEWNQWAWNDIKYDEVKHESGEWNWDAIAETVVHVCPKCEHKTPNTVAARRAMSDRSSYKVQQCNSVAKHVTFHWPAWAVHWIEWSDIVREWLEAQDFKKKGETNYLRQFTQKRAANVWRVVSDLPQLALTAGNYSKSEYIDGQLIDNEMVRFMTIDRQRDHFWVLVRAWRGDGSSRLLWEGKVLTEETIRELQLRMKVRDKLTFEDAQYFTGTVYDNCSAYGWTALHGSGQDGFNHLAKQANSRPIKKFFSPYKMADAPSGGRASYIFWSNEGIKDQLVQLRARGAPFWEFPVDVSKEWIDQMNSEVKKDVIDKATKKLKMRYVKVKANHLWDCEAMQVAAAMMVHILKSDQEVVKVDNQENA